MVHPSAGEGTASPARPFLWWTLWALFAAAWTAGLLSTASITVRDEVLPSEARFPAGKALHVAAYALFVVLSGRLPPRRLLLAVVVLHAPLTEYLQQFVGRESSLVDVLIDWFGILLGILLTRGRWFP